ncbi:hypothetical protein CSB07_01700 [Candidatus Gracilibacteria bacterium]|nr:MAG: hypothetical protein CSB07_01700 [Candidatus Gracilibacteria bacterium]
MNNKKNTILELKEIGISFDRGKSFIIKDLSFCLTKGEVLSIIGMNGTGKSTLLKAIAGINNIYSGKIIKKYKKVSYVPQKIYIDKTFPITVSEFIKVYNENITPKDLMKYLKIFGMEKKKDKSIVNLSGGEFQKVLIISALISKPELVLLDEPTSGIDIIGEEDFYKIISQIRKKFPELSIILVSHNLNLVYKNSDNIICLHKNNFCCHGTPAKLGENEEIRQIFGDFLAPYKHNPHKKHSHN